MNTIYSKISKIMFKKQIKQEVILLIVSLVIALLIVFFKSIIYDARLVNYEDLFNNIIINKSTKQDVIKLVGNPDIKLTSTSWRYRKLVRPLFDKFLTQVSAFDFPPSFMKDIKFDIIFDQSNIVEDIKNNSCQYQQIKYINVNSSIIKLGDNEKDVYAALKKYDSGNRNQRAVTENDALLKFYGFDLDGKTLNVEMIPKKDGSYILQKMTLKSNLDKFTNNVADKDAYVNMSLSEHIWIIDEVLRDILVPALIGFILLIVFLLIIIPGNKPFLGLLLPLSAYLLGLILWLTSLAITLGYAGMFWTIAGLFFGLVGIIPVAIITCIAYSLHFYDIYLIFLTIIIVSIRLVNNRLVNMSEHKIRTKLQVIELKKRGLAIGKKIIKELICITILLLMVLLFIYCRWIIYEQRFAGNEDPFVNIIINKTTKQDVIKLVGHPDNSSNEGIVWEYLKYFRPLFGAFGPLMQVDGYSIPPSYMRVIHVNIIFNENGIVKDVQNKNNEVRYQNRKSFEFIDIMRDVFFVPLGLLTGWVVKFCFLIFLPLFLFPKTRPLLGVILILSSYVFSLALWIGCLFNVFLLAGIFWVIIGLLLALVGILPVALISCVLYGDYCIIGLMLYSILFIGARLGGYRLIHMDKNISFSQTATITQPQSQYLIECPKCKQKNVVRAFTENGGMGDSCPNCKESLQKMKGEI